MGRVTGNNRVYKQRFSTRQGCKEIESAIVHDTRLLKEIGNPFLNNK